MQVSWWTMLIENQCRETERIYQFHCLVPTVKYQTRPLNIFPLMVHSKLYSPRFKTAWTLLQRTGEMTFRWLTCWKYSERFDFNLKKIAQNSRRAFWLLRLNFACCSNVLSLIVCLADIVMSILAAEDIELVWTLSSTLYLVVVDRFQGSFRPLSTAALHRVVGVSWTEMSCHKCS